MSKEVIDFFDGLAPKWENNPKEYNTRERIISMSLIRPNSIIADIGCGTGVMFEHILKTNPKKLYATDISGKMIQLAKNGNSDNRIEYMNGDLLKMSLPILDAAIIFNAYPHFMDKVALAKKLAQIIKKNGTAIIAHSVSKEKINAVHDGEMVSKVSVPLEDAKVEAAKFDDFFLIDVVIDNDEIYFIKMRRR
jgi:demethylmenaquinone methyltransferase/2-methoxy-6-polyprenyl-1,4-benzoquinol methylase